MAVLIPKALTNLNRLDDYMSVSSSFPEGDTNLFIHLTNALSTWAHRVTRRQTFKYRVTTTELHDGRRDDTIITRLRPVISVEALYDSTTQVWDSGSLLATTEYFLSSTGAGIIRRFEGCFTEEKNNVRIDYTSGYNEFFIMTGVNDQLTVTDDDGQFTITLTEGEYNAGTLVTEVQTQLLAGATNATYVVAYSQVSDRFSITASGTAVFSIDFSGADTRIVELGKLLGYVTSVDRSGALVYYADYPALGVPEDITHAMNEVIFERYELTRERRHGKGSFSNDSSSMTFTFQNLPEPFIDTIMAYRDIVVEDVY